MGANKFATMLYKNNTPKIVIVLIYTLLEWTLIAFLLLNGLFSYLIMRFADFFGLKPPCIFCSRVDHVFGPRKSYRDLMCDAHAAQISKLGFCSNHRNLAEAGEMCEDCSSSRPLEMAVFSWMKRSEDGEKDLRCSCCDVILESGFYSPYNFVVKASSFGVLECTQKGEDGNDDVNLAKEHEDREFEEKGETFVGDNCDARVKVVDDESFEDREVEGKGESLVVENCDACVKLVVDESFEDREVGGGSLVVDNCDVCVKVVDDESLELLTPMRAENGLLGVEERLVPIELIDSSTLIKNKLNSDVPTQGDDEDVDDEDDDRDYFGYNLVEKDDTSLDVGTVLEGGRLVSSELIDFSNFIDNNLNSVDEGDDRDYVRYKLVEKDDSDSDIGTVSEEEEEKETLLSIKEINNSQSLPLVNVVEDESSLQSNLISEEGLVAQVEEEHAEGFNNSQSLPLVNVVEDESSLQSNLISEEGLDAQVEEEHAEGFGEFQASEEDKVIDAEANCEISIGSEICDNEQVDLPHFNDLAIPHSACANEQCLESYNVIIDKGEDTHFVNLACADEQCSESYNVINDKEHVTEAEQAEPTEDAISRNVNELSIHTELKEIEEERVPETPTSIDSLHVLHKRFLYERREFGTESLDGSVASEIDGNEVLTVDHLKAALKAERRALSALYAELEEERSASAIAANQTMAMITRLQEEKAAMQMEALQYQRMMDEQSEYDQEALQLLNELMMKREKEKQELEKELEVCRKKVYYYEAKERRKAAERMKTNGNGSGTSSSSSSAEDSDDLSFEPHEGEECNYTHNACNQNTPIHHVLNSLANQEEDNTHLMTLDESLADFEEERISILEQLKALEEKLFSMDEDELKSMGHHHFSDENGHGSNGDYESSNGFEHDMDTNGKLHHKPRNVASGGKRLLPLFEATNDEESENELSPTHETMNGSPHSLSKPAIDDHKKLAIAEEVDNVYERLQALEADREFLKHCVRSLKKGDKGMDLLQEILQHLRDLRNVELCVRNAGDAFASLSV